VGLPAVDRLLRLIDVCNGRLQTPPATIANGRARAELRRLLADAAEEIATLKRAAGENATAAMCLSLELANAQAENDSLRHELIDVRSQAIGLQLGLLDAARRLAAAEAHRGGRLAHLPAALSEPVSALVELKRMFARRYHPNAAGLSGRPYENTLRAELFKEFWADITAIEAKYKEMPRAPNRSAAP
jgi:hypothetical protein